MATLLQDLRVAVRSAWRDRPFAAGAALTLALGMTLCTIAMAVTKAYLLNDLPYPAANRLYSIRYAAPGQPSPRGMEALDWRSLDDVIEHPVAWDLDAFYLLGGDHAETILGAWVTPGFVAGLGIAPALGRGFDAASFSPGGENAVLISHRLHVGRFGGDPNVVGRSFTAYVSDRPQEAERFTIIGVLPANFWHINGYTDILAPLRAPTFPYMARLQVGVTPRQAADRIGALARGGAREVPPGWAPELISTHEQYVERTRPILWTASAAAFLVLFVACANVAALMLVRAVRRQKEIAVRAALGARRSAIARMLFAEALVIGMAAISVAVVASALVLRWLAPFVQQQLGRPAPGGVGAFAMDVTTMALAIAVGAITIAVCALAPLLSATSSGARHALQSAGRGATEGPASRRMRGALIAFEVAVSLMLLVGSTLMLRTMAVLLGTDFGFSSERVVMSSITLRQNRYPDASTRLAAFERIESRLSAIPGTEAVGLTSAWPVQQPGMQRVEPAGASASTALQTGVHRVNASYFAALGIPIVAGRPFTSADRLGSEPVALVSQTLAGRLWPAGDAVGRRLIVPQPQDRGEPVPVEHLVVGIVRDVRQGASDEDVSDAYLPMLQSPSRFTFVLARTAGDPASWVAPLRQAFREIDPEVSVQSARPLQLVVDELMARPRFLTGLLGAFALAAAVLALVGVYGVIAYAIRQREREIAVRMALGADRQRVIGLFVRQGSWILLVGVVFGLIGALAAGRVIESQLFGVTPRDPVTLVASAAAFALAGLLAIWWPSRRAASTDPAIALRVE